MNQMTVIKEADEGLIPELDKTVLTEELVKVGLASDRIKVLVAGFGGFYRQAQEVCEKAKGVRVDDESQVNKMQEARDYRRNLSNIRINTEKTRKRLKEQSLREGKAIDGVANIIKAVIVPVEQHLEKQEKFIENLKLERLEKLKAERLAKLQPYIGDVFVFKVGEMSEEAFEKLLETSKVAHEAKVAAEKKAEEERLAAEKAELAERKRLKEENERLKEERKKREAEKAKQDAILAKEKAKQDAILAAEKKKREEAEAKIAAEKAEKERIQREKEVEQRKALLAPDKEKLLSFANMLDKLELPAMSSREAGKIIDEAQNLLSKVSSYVRANAKKL